MTTSTDSRSTTADQDARPFARHWIGGEWTDSAEHRESVDPATGEVIGRYALGGGAAGLPGDELAQ